MIDLHLHTTASADAQHSPTELFAMAAERGLVGLAFADHNTVAAVPDGRRLSAETGLAFISGVELNTELDGVELHLLGYGFDEESPAAREWFAEISNLFWEQARRRVARFNELGLTLTAEEVVAGSGGRLPTGSSFLDALADAPDNRRHPLIAPYLQAREGENRYIRFYFEVMAAGGPADVGGASLPIRRAIVRCREIKAVPVLAHPRDLPESGFAELVAAGLLGVEAVCSYHSPAQRSRWLELAERHRVLYTAGSDFHGMATKPEVRLGDLTHNDLAVLDRLRRAQAGL